MKKRSLFIASLILIFLFGAIYLIKNIPSKVSIFDGARAYKDVTEQVGFGSRIPQSIAHQETVSYITQQLKNAGWNYAIKTQVFEDHIATNILAMRNSDYPSILLGAHYDSRISADHDPDPTKRSLPVPGANDGASGVAVLLELARVLPQNSIPVSLVFLDLEDNGNLPGWNWIIGSNAFAASLTEKPKVVIILDMVGDKNLNIFMEKNSDSRFTKQIWNSANSLGYRKYFIPSYKYQVLDDHIPFIESGIPSLDIIDLDYPYWHTSEDTPDKVSGQSLKIVGETLLKWITSYGPCIQAENCPDTSQK